MAKVQAGLVQDVLKTFKSFSDKLSSTLNSITKLGTKILDSSSDGDSQIISMKTPKGNTIQDKLK